MTPRASARQGIIASRYIQSEENISMHAEEEEKEGGMPETPKRSGTPTSENGDSDDVMTEVEWRHEEHYMTPTKQGKKRIKGKGVRRAVTPERPIPNVLQTPRRRKLEADWAKPAEEVTNERGVINLEDFIGEYLRNTNRLRDFMLAQEKFDMNYE